MISYKNLARVMYSAYREKAVGRIIDGYNPLPTWKELGIEHQASWVAAAQAAVLELQAVH
jgi:hypothetical protein